VSQRKPKVLVAMSGGVDSSVAAALLLREGFEVVGCFMRLGSPGETFDELMEDDHAGSDGQRKESPGRAGQVGCDPHKIRIGHQGCCSINDAADARLVAAKLGIPFYVVNFKKDFGRIIDYFVGEYNAGRTPNPCVRCNDWLKFGRLHEYAKQIDAEYVASGHYARISHSTPTHCNAWASPRLLRGIDHAKDQSYVLFGAPRARLAEMLLPIGGHQKARVREMARELGLPVFDKPDSQEICFVPDNDYAGLVKQRTPEAMTRGRIVDTAGKILGEHEGQQHFTVGQRKGVGLALGDRVYVVSKDAATNTVVVGDREELRCEGLIARETNWLIGPPPFTNIAQRAGPSSAPSDIGRPSAWLPCTAKIRYNAQPVEAKVRRTAEDELEVRFVEPQYAVAPGQAVVCYEGEAVMCGGWIATAR
jgi:tRNA-uridine 2-sulfurtransferase